MLQNLSQQNLHQETVWNTTHPAITSPTQTRKKFGAVFDALVKFVGKSLNDYLLKGLDLLNSLVTVLLRFRNRKYFISADIKKTFHQIFVKQNERNCLRFLWRDNANLVIDKYKMNVHTFGKNDSPSIQNFSLKQCAKDQQK